jgi:alpha-galactosidase/6-phospho-beta-glucosidase family protein
MAPRITIVGGGSHQWVPRLVNDIAHTRALREAEIVLEDIDGSRLPRLQAYVEHVASVLDIPLRVRSTTDQRDALTGADFVVVNISTGGLRSMAHDLDLPTRYGIHQSVGDTVGPGGIMRALRNIPVLIGVARDMEEQCPGAWLRNLTNPMTTLCRAVSRETSVRTIGLCHEVTVTHFYLSLLLDLPFFDIGLTITGVNHLPVITAIDAKGGDGLAQLQQLVAGDDLDQPLPFDLPADLGHEPLPGGRSWTKRDLLNVNRLKMELFRLTGALPGAGDRHLAEFFAGFLTEASGYGKRWGVELSDIAGRQRWEDRYVAELEARLASDEISDMPSGEMVHTVIRCLMTGDMAILPLNIPNAGQSPGLPPEAVVESMCIVDADGVRGRDQAAAPPLLAEQLRRVVAAQELTVEAALAGDPELAFDAMLADPLAGRIDYDQLRQLTGEMLDATREWLPQFA